MKTVSLILNILLCCALHSFADTKVIWFTADNIGDEFDLMGQFYALSDNGEYGVITDDEMNLCYLWTRSDPQKLKRLNWTEDGRIIPLEIRGISDFGTVTGSYRPYQSSSWVPFVQSLGGEPEKLPVPANISNMNFPCAISADASIIGGYLSAPRMMPVIWTRNADGSYDLNYNKDLRLPHQGFAVTCMYTDGTLEGTFLGGTLYCGSASNISALYNRGEMIMWNRLHSERVPWYYKGTLMDYEIAAFIDDKRDLYFHSEDYINSGFYCADRQGNFYGTRMIVGKSITDDMDDPNYGLTEGDQYMWGRYDVNSGEWENIEGYQQISTALDPKTFFVNETIYRDGLNGSPESLPEVLGYSSDGHNVMGVSRASADGRVIGMTYQATDPMGVPHVYPFVIMSDEPLSSIQHIIADNVNKQVVIIADGHVEVAGANDIRIYDLNGLQVPNRNLPSGIYIISADGISHKIQIR